MGEFQVPTGLLKYWKGKVTTSVNDFQLKLISEMFELLNLLILTISDSIVF